MIYARLMADWLAALQAADEAAPDLESLADLDIPPTGKLAVVWDADRIPTAQGLDIYELTYEIRRAKNSDITAADMRAAQVWVEAQFDTDNFATLETAVTGETGDDLQSWYLGEAETDDTPDAFLYRRDVKLAVVTV